MLLEINIYCLQFTILLLFEMLPMYVFDVIRISFICQVVIFLLQYLSFTYYRYIKRIKLELVLLFVSVVPTSWSYTYRIL